MVTFEYGDFFIKARKMDPETKEPIYPELYSASKMLKRIPLTGNGSRGGGYICVCEYCGSAFHTYVKSRKFCDHSCKAQYTIDHQQSAHITKSGQIRGIITRKCECCGETFSIKHSFLHLGKGIYCSPTCYRKMRPLQAQWFVCNRCGTHFKALTDQNAKFCCIECDKVSPRYDDNNGFINYGPITRDNTTEVALRCQLNNRVVELHKNRIKRVFRDTTPNKKDIPTVRFVDVLAIEKQIDEEEEIRLRKT